MLFFLILACSQPDPSDSGTGDPDDTGVSDTGTRDTGTDDTGTDDTGDDTDPVDTGEDTGPLPPRLQARRWKLTFADEFNGPETPGDPCYDATQTPAQCMTIYWHAEDCDPAHNQRLAQLNKCTWAVYDIYNWMDWGKPLEGHGINNLDPSQVEVRDGSLWLSAEPVGTITWQPGQAWPWDCGNGGTESEGWLTTKDCPIRAGAVNSNPTYAPTGFDQTYGRFEVRAIIPNQTGSWPAHWLLPTTGGWPDEGEIDVMEAVAHAPTDVHGSFHGGMWDGTTHVHHSKGNHHDPGWALADDWHVYAVEWSPGVLRFFVDDTEIGQVWEGESLVGDVLSSDTAATGSPWAAFPVDVPDWPFYWILNTSIVPTGGFSLKDFQAVDHRIDWVRVYQPCQETDTGCVVRGSGTSKITDEAWMSGPKWSEAYRVLHTGDFDGDGIADLLLQTRLDAHATYLLRGDTLGRFAHEETLTTRHGMSAAHWNDQYRSLHTGDFNGDGRTDVLLRGRTESHDTFLLLANETGFADVVDLSTALSMDREQWSDEHRSALVADFTGDGYDDVLLLNRKNTRSTLMLRGSAAGLTTRVDLTSAHAMSAARWSTQFSIPQVGDFDGDSDADLLLRGRDSSEPTWMLKGGPDGFEGDRVDLAGTADMSAGDWGQGIGHVADFDGDGRDDLLLQQTAFTGSTWLLPGGGTTLLRARQVLTGAYGTTYDHWRSTRIVVHPGDLTGDGRADLLLQPLDHRARTWMLRGTATGFMTVEDITLQQTLGVPQWRSDERQAVVADFDGDGRSDVLLRARQDDGDSYLIFLP